MQPRVAAQSPQYYPAFLDLRGRRVVLVGGGSIAAAKLAGLLPCNPRPLVLIAPDVVPAIRSAAAAGHVQWLARPYADGDLAGASVAFAATDDRAANARVAAEARARGIPVLAVDDAPNCDFIAPAVVKRGDLVIAISTGGRSPAVARRVRERLDALLPAHWAGLLEVAAAVRERLGPRRRTVAPDQWQIAMGNEQLDALLRDGQLERAAELLLARLEPTG